MRSNREHDAGEEGGKLAPDEEASAQRWSALVDAANIESLLVYIAVRLGPALRQRVEAVDVLQETLMAAWRDRAGAPLDDSRQFRVWLLAVVENRIRDMADHAGAKKRGGHLAQEPLHPGALAAGSTTPSRIAWHREAADVMRQALEQVPEDCRHVVFLRLFRQMTLREVAAELGLGLGTVRGLLRRGAELYRQRLQAAVIGQTSLEAP